MRLVRPRCAQLLRTTAIIGILAASVAGCTTSRLGDITNSAGGALGGALFASSAPASAENVSDWRKEVNAAGSAYRTDPRSANAALRYAEALRKTGQRAQAAAVLQQASIHNPHDKRVLGDYGRALAETGQLALAYQMLERAHSPDQPDWRVLSAQGAVLDQMGRHDAARTHYEAALKIVPGEPSVLSNLGLSYALSKELPQAEQTLRKAAERGSKDKRVRQNLALVIGLQGRFKEAEDIARADLPPAEAVENVAYLRSMLPQGPETTATASAQPAQSRNVASKPVPRGKAAAAKRPAQAPAPQASQTRPLVLSANTGN